MACETAVKDIYKSYQTPEIKLFIESSGLYEKKGWSPIRKAAKGSFNETDLYLPFRRIIEAVLQHFHTDDSYSPSVINTNQAGMKDSADGTDYVEIMGDGSKKPITVKTSPDLSILGNGPHFTQDKDARPGYDRCVAPIEIKQHENLNMHNVQLQIEVYSGQCFIRQPNRRYVPSVVITERELILFVHDRSGWIHSRNVDIHREPESFVRIIIGISSIDDNLRNSPFDHRITWYKTPQPASGKADDSTATGLPIVTVNNPLITQKRAVGEEYRVTIKSFHRQNIFGRGTICWRSEREIDGRRMKVLIKECWRPANRPGECEFMDAIKDLAGVGQILAYNDDRDYRISHFRDFIFQDLYKTELYAHDRIFSRLVLKAYGKSIRNFKSKIQLLEAFRDAVAGHKSLWLRGILHRDVSVDNILLGEEGAPEGYRGILIDFDMAIRVDTTPQGPSHLRTGTRAFQSVAVLSVRRWDELAPPQDHLDDLESYFYVLSWMCHKYDGTNVSVSPSHLDWWEAKDVDLCASTKIEFLGTPIAELPPSFQTPVFKTLLADLGKLCKSWFNKKKKSVNKSIPFSALHLVHEADKLKGAEDHNKFLAIIDAALEAQRRESEEVCPNHVPQPHQSNPAEQHDNNPSRPDYLSQKRPAPDPVPQAAPARPSKRLKMAGCALTENLGVGFRRSARLANLGKPNPE